LNDGSCLSNLQVICDQAIPGFEELSKSLAGSSFMVEGVLKESPAKGQKFELHATSVKMLGGSDDRYPIGKGTVKPETLRTVLHLRPRTNIIGCVARVRSALAFATHEFFRNNGFL
jgi:asparaginyl-tRNA synthetase